MKMRRIVYLLLALIGISALSSCTTTSKLSVANSANVSQANFHKIGTISRSYTATYIIGMGGGVKAKKLASAIEEMTYTLGPNQALAYINVVESTTFPILPIIITQTTTVSAVKIQFDE